MIKSDKIIFHGLFDNKLIFLLFFNQYLLSKCHWAIWGGDLYSKVSRSAKFYLLKDFVKKRVIKKIKYLITYVNGDVQFAREWYGATGTQQSCIGYLSNVYKEQSLSSDEAARKSDVVTIQVGNSADLSNAHLEVFNILKSLEKQDFTIRCPLSYGSEEYADEVETVGYSIFKDRFYPSRKFLPLNEYQLQQQQIDIGVFNHNRQQGMGNIISLIGMGKKVYLRKDTTHWFFFCEIDVKVFDITELNLEPIEETVAKNNIENIKSYFSVNNLIKQWDDIFSSACR
ncbi:TDP-N-acetylfucosamine:lipid II N-acetylfucosaminyltransferase [uncultured Shewanella sp.]|uniref:TDP-N-acetylfucosamine:lipid II N-acetylfucosaminyltransferase n=1 Tax=uncultured Shewanella sp. TaxID=173975 RepID=UPI002630C313|nr:TDP-N-acetylfucosamine:lipid II N-acetylfucosaminyltransferase [uncultured Shewanella sp.]